MVTPVLPEEMEEYLSKQDVLRLKVGHYFWWGWTGPLMLVYLVFLISFLVPYEAAQYLHLVYIARLVVLNSYFNSLYRLIHKYSLVTMAYTLFLMIYLILYLSTLFGCIFYVIDQTLIDTQYFGDPALNPNRTSPLKQSTTRQSTNQPNYVASNTTPIPTAMEKTSHLL